MSLLIEFGHIERAFAYSLWFISTRIGDFEICRSRAIAMAQSVPRPMVQGHKPQVINKLMGFQKATKWCLLEGESVTNAIAEPSADAESLGARLDG